MANEALLGLLQFTALILPAIAIYLDFVYGDVDPKNLQENDVAVLEGEIHRGRLSVLFFVIGGSVLLLQILIGAPSTGGSLIATSSCSYLNILGICVSTFLSTVSILFLSLGLAMFAFLLAFGKNARHTDTPLVWGGVEIINQLKPGADSPEDRIFQPNEVNNFFALFISFIALIGAIVAIIIISIFPEMAVVVTGVISAIVASFVALIITLVVSVVYIIFSINSR